jgi:hypothetical protein
MQVSSINNSLKNYYWNNQQVSQKFYTIPFTAMKKSDFSGIDLFVVENEKSPIEKFNSNEEFQNWARLKTLNIFNKNYEGRKSSTKNDRYDVLSEWMRYFVQYDKNKKYSPATQLMVFHSITSNLKTNEDKLPPTFNRDAFKATIDEIEERLKLNPKEKFSFRQIYRKNLFLTLGITPNSNPYEPHWVYIPSKIHDPENFELNVKKLEAVSDLYWCTAYKNAANWYLQDKDMHIYVENLKPKVAVVTTADNKLWELQSKWNNHVPPIEYMDNVVSPYLNEKNIKNDDKRFICKYIETGFKKQIKDFHQTVNKNNIKEILNYFGIEATKDKKDGLYIISHYGMEKAKNNENYFQHFEDFGINENDLFKFIKEIKDYANFQDTNVTNLGNLKRIGGNALFTESKLNNLSKLEYIGGDALFKDSLISDLGNLKEIGGDACFDDSMITSLGQLKRIGGYADFKNCFVTTLNNLEEIGKILTINNANITDFGNLRKIGYALFGNIYGAEIKHCKNLKYIGEGGTFIFNKNDYEKLKPITKGETRYYSKHIKN